MKKIIFSIALVLAAGISSTFANNNDGISKSAKNAFSRDFSTATNVKWQQQKNVDKATFNFNSQVMFAYYDLHGSLMAVSRNITSENLPISLQADLKNSYSNYWISDLFETDAEGATTYYVTLENSDQKIILSSVDSNAWSIFRRTVKDVE